MKKYLLVFLFLSGLVVNAEDFTNKYYMCTLVEKDSIKIIQRKAETLNMKDVELTIKKTKMIFRVNSWPNPNTNSFPYIDTSKKNGFDLYGYKNDMFNNTRLLVYNDKTNELIEEWQHDTYFKNKEYHPESSRIYQCRKATFYEKAKMIANSF